MIFIVGIYTVVIVVMVLYVTSALAYFQKLNTWIDEREGIFVRLFQCADTMSTLPPGHRSTLDSAINYETLQKMTTILIAQEDARRVYLLELRNVINELRTWEAAHPVPEKPRWVR